MQKSDLNHCLSKIFTANGFTANHSVFLKKLCALIAYYSSDDLSEKLRQDINKIHLVLLKLDLYEEEEKEIPTRYYCVLEGKDSISQFTFAPRVSVSLRNDDLDCRLKIIDELSGVDISSLVNYVKEKAIVADDFVLE